MNMRNVIFSFVVLLSLICSMECVAENEAENDVETKRFYLVSDESQLYEGDEIVIVGRKVDNKSIYMAMSEKNTSNYGAEPISLNDDETITPDEKTRILVLQKKKGYWCLKDGGDFLYCGSTTSSGSLKAESSSSNDSYLSFSFLSDKTIIAEFYKSKIKSELKNKRFIGCYTHNSDYGYINCYDEATALTYPIWFYVFRSTSTLDEKDDKVSASIKPGAQNISVNRAFHKGGWNTWCMPFDISVNALKKVFGDATEVSEFKAVKNENGMMQFCPVAETLFAGTPYLVKPEKEVENPMFESVYVADGVEPKDVTIDGYSFCGTFAPYTMADNGTELFLNSKNLLAKPSANSSKMRGFRAYFKIKNPQNEAKVGFVDTPTGVGEIKMDKPCARGVYNLYGQKLQQNIESLPHGIYIINGNKLYKK